MHGCEKNPIIPNEEELITTLTLDLVPVTGGPVKSYVFRDIDGDGGAPPDLAFDTLDQSNLYAGRIQLFNETTNPVTIVTHEVEEEDEDHQFFYSVPDSSLDLTYTDMDASGYPVGMHTIIGTHMPVVSSLTITLRHLPEKNAPGVNTGDIMNAGGETDIEVIFPLIIR
jgi:hypothetical protein